MRAQEDNPLRGEENLAAAMVESAILVLQAPDEAQHIFGIEDLPGEEPLHRNERQRLNRLFRAAGEPALDEIPSAHQAELVWLNHFEPCAMPVTLVARLLDTTPAHIRSLVALRVPGLEIAGDGTLVKKGHAFYQTSAGGFQMGEVACV